MWGVSSLDNSPRKKQHYLSLGVRQENSKRKVKFTSENRLGPTGTQRADHTEAFGPSYSAALKTVRWLGLEKAPSDGETKVSCLEHTPKYRFC